MASFFWYGTAFEHGATFSLILILSFMITVLTQIYKDQDRFKSVDLNDRIEIEKLKMKLKSRLMTRLEEKYQKEQGKIKGD